MAFVPHPSDTEPTSETLSDGIYVFDVHTMQWVEFNNIDELTGKHKRKHVYVGGAFIKIDGVAYPIRPNIGYGQSDPEAPVTFLGRLNREWVEVTESNARRVALFRVASADAERINYLTVVNFDGQITVTSSALTAINGEQATINPYCQLNTPAGRNCFEQAATVAPAREP